ncbi:MAG: polysaccharide deacetylase family protein [Gammaproteobacteria bacterium]|nr:polysaccharide deacetylase family protein [Gammaproteobacteria bacterium]
MTPHKHPLFLLISLLSSCLVYGSQGFSPQGRGQTPELTVLTYHDIVADPGDDRHAVSRSTFVAQMDYLQRQGYQPVTLSLLDNVAKKQALLPNKAVLLSFDDGLESYYQFVAPLLKIYNYPSVLSVVTGWVDGKNIPLEYNGKLIQWPQLRELNQSPLVEIISHSHDLHHSVQANPQGNEAAAGVTRLYSASTHQYETENQFRQRIKLDLKHSINRLKQELGITPIGITWPYGRYDNVLAEEAKLLGLRYQLNLNDGPTTVSQFPNLSRIMVMNNNNLQSFINELNYTYLNREQQRFADIYLDNFIGQPSTSQEALLSALIDNLQQLKINTIVVHPFSRDTRQAFFFNHQIKIATNILNHVTHQIQTRLNIRHVYLSLPKHLPNELSVKNSHDLYSDLSRLNPFNGIIFNQHTPQQIEQIKKITRYYQPNAKFGHYGKTDKPSEYDFAIIPIKASLSPEAFRKKILEAKGLPMKLLFYVEDDNYNAKSLPAIVETLRSLGVQHYGIASRKDLYSFNLNAINNTYELADGTLAVLGG